MKIIRRVTSLILFIPLLLLTLVAIIVNPLICLLYKESSWKESYAGLKELIEGLAGELWYVTKTGNKVK